MRFTFTALRQKLLPLLVSSLDACLSRLELRRIFVLSIDACLLLLSVWLTFWLRLPYPDHVRALAEFAWFYQASLVLGLPIFLLTGQYKGLTRYVGSGALYQLSARTGLLSLFLYFWGFFFSLPSLPASAWFLFWILLTCLSGAIVLFRVICFGWQRNARCAFACCHIWSWCSRCSISSSFALRGSSHTFGFVDDDPQLWGRSISGVDVIPQQHLQRLQPDQVFLAIPSLQRSSRRRIVEKLQSIVFLYFKFLLLMITSGRTRIDSLRPVAIEELLGRDPVPPDPELLGPGISGKVILVSGAGGSIGSELCRQILF